MTLNFPASPHADDAIKARTEDFYEMIQYREIPESELVKMVHQGIALEARNGDQETVLLKAAQFGRTKTVQALLAAGADIKASNKNGETAMVLAAFGGRTNTVKALLGAGASADERDADGTSALTWAARTQNLETLQVLLAAGANIESRDNKGHTALITAAQYNRTKAIKTLLEAGANIHARENFNAAAWMMTGNKETIKSLNPEGWCQSYEEFTANGTAPKTAKEVYRLLAMVPLADPKAPVDYVENIRKIFANAQWADKEQAADVLTQMQGDGRINAKTVDSILHNIFHERSHTERLQRYQPGMAL